MLIYLNPDELHYYPFMVSLHMCDGSCNTAEDPFGKLRVPSNIEDANVNVFNMIAGINKLKTLMKHISCAHGCKFHDRKCNLNQKWNHDKCQCECEKTIKHCVCKKGFCLES